MAKKNKIFAVEKAKKEDNAETQSSRRSAEIDQMIGSGLR
jgi:hypothetical protein